MLDVVFCGHCGEDQEYGKWIDEFICNNCGMRNYGTRDITPEQLRARYEEDEDISMSGHYAIRPSEAYLWCEAWSDAYDNGKASEYCRLHNNWKHMNWFVRVAAAISGWDWIRNIKD